MAFKPEHEIHRRRFSRNLGLGLVLAGFVALVFALTVVKVTRGDPMQAFDHQVRPELAPAEAAPVQPLLAQPLLAQPLLAQPLLAQPLLAQPLLAEPGQ